MTMQPDPLEHLVGGALDPVRYYEAVDVSAADHVFSSVTRYIYVAAAGNVAFTPASAPEFEEHIVPIISGGSGAGAIVDHLFVDANAFLFSGGSGAGAELAVVTVDNQGRITAVTWTARGVNYVAGDVVTIAQGDARVLYVLLAADVVNGRIQNLAGKTLVSGSARKFSSTLPPIVSGGSGANAHIAFITVDDYGRIMNIRWLNRGAGYAAGDTLTFIQGHARAQYTLLAEDLSGGELLTFVDKAIDSQAVEVDDRGRITDVRWANGGAGYAAADVITITQGDISGTYTLLAADVSGGALQFFRNKAIPPAGFNFGPVAVQAGAWLHWQLKAVNMTGTTATIIGAW